MCMFIDVAVKRRSFVKNIPRLSHIFNWSLFHKTVQTIKLLVKNNLLTTNNTPGKTGNILLKKTNPVHKC